MSKFHIMIVVLMVVCVMGAGFTSSPPPYHAKKLPPRCFKLSGVTHCIFHR